MRTGSVVSPRQIIAKTIATALRAVLPVYLARQVEFEIKIALKHCLYSRDVRRQLAPLKECRVNVGCGPQPLPGWINLEVSPAPNVYFWDCRRRLPFSDNAVSAIYSEHAFEHLDLETEAKPFLEECRRCLRPGGVIRLVVPDAGAYIALYGEQWDLLAAKRWLKRVENGWQDYWSDNIYSTQMQLINWVFRQDYEHKYAYDEETLTLVLRQAGFSKVIRQSYGISLDSEMAQDREDRRSESLYIEAVK